MKSIFLIITLLSVLLNSEETQYRDNLVGLECTKHGPFLIDDEKKEAVMIAGGLKEKIYPLTYTDYEDEILLVYEIYKFISDPTVDRMRFIINKDTLNLKVTTSINGSGFIFEEFEFSCTENTKEVIEKMGIVSERTKKDRSNRVIQ
tara:strand:+ start:119 stop:559 length:441 start_codon:yes stop_codon:yes gene_type:complete